MGLLTISNLNSEGVCYHKRILLALFVSCQCSGHKPSPLWNISVANKIYRDLRLDPVTLICHRLVYFQHALIVPWGISYYRPSRAILYIVGSRLFVPSVPDFPCPCLTRMRSEAEAQRVPGTRFLAGTLSTHTKKLADALRQPLLHLSSEN